MLSRSRLLLLLWVETGALALLWAQGHRRHAPPPTVPPPAPVAAAPDMARPTTVATQTPHSAPPSLPLRAWKLAFVRGNDVWTADRDGTQARLLIRHADRPRWSGDHKQIAFARDNNIWTVGADGTGARPLTTQWKPEPDHEGYAGYGIEGLTWDPLTDTVLFSHNETLTLKRDGADTPPRKDFLHKNITTLDADSLFAVSAQPGANRAPVGLLDVTEQGTTFGFSHQEQPAFSRSGKILAFARNGDIWIAKRGERRDMEANLEDWQAWEWDVTRLKAVADYDDPNYHGSRWNLGVTGLAWSPDEKYLAYALHRLNGSGQAEIYLLTVSEDDGSMSAGETRKLRDDNVADPCFTPDGKWIAYSHIGYANDTDGHSIWLTSPDGKTSRKLLSNAEQPAW